MTYISDITSQIAWHEWHLVYNNLQNQNTPTIFPGNFITLSQSKNPQPNIQPLHHMKKKQPVKVIVPVYRIKLNEFEKISLEQNNRVLHAYPRVFIKPQSLDISELLKEFPEFSVESFDDTYFTSIQSYNRLMMSPELYQRFSDTEYMLLCQLDAYIFRDELAEWCQKGYDYIGAPWVIPFSYRLPFIRQYRNWIRKPGIEIRDNKVGNGGLSLRKISSHLKATEKLQDIVRHYLSQTAGYLYNEDVFFSLEVNRHGMDFQYPTLQEALRFSFDRYSSLCYRKNHKELPFGCHGWFNRRERKFWFPLLLPTYSSLPENS